MMNKKTIIVIAVLLATISVSGCIKTPMGNINDIIPNLSKSIESGDLNYNEAVSNSNSNDYVAAEKKVQNASTDFLDAQSKILEIKKYEDRINDTLYIQYIDLIEQELVLKQNATSYLQLGIQSFRNGDKKLANEYISSANNIMSEAVSIQNQRENLVKNNPNKFK